MAKGRKALMNPSEKGREGEGEESLMGSRERREK